jgi:DNA excision repair protein ERCC-2
MEVLFRHSRIRKGQKEMVKDVLNALENGQNLLAHAPCGIGKTDASLSPALTYALEHNLTVFFLTPKISQHKIAIEVVKGISEKYDLEIPSVDIIGRRYACIHPYLQDLDYDSFYTACEQMRKEEMCPYFNALNPPDKKEYYKAHQLLQKLANLYRTPKLHNETIEIGEKFNACPYEIMLKLAPSSKLIICDYFHIFSPKIREVMLSKMRRRMDQLIVIVDEAHNLPQRVREHLSSSFNIFMCKRVEQEMKEMNEPCPPLVERMKQWAEERISKNIEVEVSKDEIKTIFDFGLDEDDLIPYLESLGAEYVEKKGKKSALIKLARFLSSWMDEAPSIRILRRRGEHFFSLSKRFLDPSLITCCLNDSYSSILMSATLIPPKMYRDILGLDDDKTIIRTYSSPFPTKHRLPLIVKDATTRFTKRNAQTYRRIAFIIDQLFDGKTAVFFPSYEVMNEVLPLTNSKPKHIQKSNMTPKQLHELVEEFSSNGGLLAGVQGGSLSEGLDFSNNEITTLIVVGIALEEMTLETKALIRYYEEKFGKGWQYAYLLPAMTKALQAAGRAIRKESDKAIIVFLDERFAWLNYRRLFPSDLQPSVVNIDEAIVLSKQFRETSK